LYTLLLAVVHVFESLRITKLLVAVLQVEPLLITLPQ
jgi:hypothetical protein